MGGTPISSYSVTYQRSTDSTYTTAGSTTSTTLQFTQVVSSPGATYNFIVYALNAAGTSLESSVLPVIAANSPSTMSAPFLIYADTTQI
jgi:energy-converting hydrogenase Eha subunit F